LEGIDAPGDLRVSHEGRLPGRHVRRERSGKLFPIQEEEPSWGGRIGGTGAPGGGSAIRVFTDSPASGANTAM
jgi:hypothetical protein